MNGVRYLERNQVPAHILSGYAGKHLRFEVTEQVTIPSDAGLWSGGTRDTYYGIRLSDGARVEAFPHHLAPWDRRADQRINLEPGYALVRHSYFCGKDHGLHFYVHPDNAAALLPAPSAELSAHEKTVLNATACFKSSYGGKDRYQMASDEGRWGVNAAPFMSRAEWEAAKQALISKGLLNKAGAITTAGRNARA